MGTPEEHSRDELRQEIGSLRQVVDGLVTAVANVPDVVRAAIEEMFPALGGDHEHTPKPEP